MWIIASVVIAVSIINNFYPADLQARDNINQATGFSTYLTGQ